MNDGDVLILKGDEIQSLLEGRERELIQLVRRAYIAHGNGNSSLPHSTFLRFPADPANRIIALPAYLGEEFEVAGIKWISSFPANIDRGLDRASGVLILSSSQTGRPMAVLDASVINARRTAASAVLAAQTLLGERTAGTVGLIGCGVVNLQIATFMLAALGGLRRFILFDLSARHAIEFKERCDLLEPDLEIDIAENIETVLEKCRLISLATTAATPHIYDLSKCSPGSIILHVSLRDLAPEVILSCDNVVDDEDHVCRAQTSIHLTEQLVGNRDFIRCGLPDLLRGRAPDKNSEHDITVFSPFGLGILDIATGKFVAELAGRDGAGTNIGSFLPKSWSRA
jgi:ornithine cyclodeaminase